MKKILPFIICIPTILSIILIACASVKADGAACDINYTETTLIGDASLADGINVHVTAEYNFNVLWDMCCAVGTSTSTQADHKLIFSGTEAASYSYTEISEASIDVSFLSDSVLSGLMQIDTDSDMEHIYVTYEEDGYIYVSIIDAGTYEEIQTLQVCTASDSDDEYVSAMVISDDAMIYECYEGIFGIFEDEASGSYTASFSPVSEEERYGYFFCIDEDGNYIDAVDIMDAAAADDGFVLVYYKQDYDTEECVYLDNSMFYVMICDENGVAYLGEYESELGDMEEYRSDYSWSAARCAIINLEVVE